MSRDRSMLSCFIVAASVFTAVDAAPGQTTWRVNDNAPGDPAPGDPSISDPLEDGSAAHPFDAIQEAIDAAGAGDEILIADGTYTGLGNKDLDFGGKAITVHSENGAENCIIDCEGEGRGFHARNGEGTNPFVEGLTITNGDASHGGAISCSDCNLTLVACTITANQATYRGGGIDCGPGSVTVIDCTISGNLAGDSGGGIQCTFGSMTFIDCIIRDNQAGRRGGGISNFDAAITLTGCTISNNSTRNPGGGPGGGLYCIGEEGSAIITDCAISGNSASDGGGLLGINVALTITGCTISNNSARDEIGGAGGGLYCFGEESSATITNCTITGNSTAASGGGVYCAHAALTVTGCTINGNSASGAPYGYGGGVYLSQSQGTARALISDSMITDNTATHGGGVHFAGAANAAMTNCTLTGNYASLYGGGVGCTWYGCDPTITNCCISGNSSDNVGGGVSCFEGHPTFANCIIADNTAVHYAGGVYCYLVYDYGPNELTFANCTLTGNSANNCGGLLSEDSTISIENSVLWHNQPAGACEVYSSISMNHCDVESGWPGDGNIDADPLFVDPDGPDDDPNTCEDNDYRLAAGSPCIDAGCNCAAPRDMADLDADGDTSEYIPIDLDGEGRFFNDPATADAGSGPPPVIDMGAYEFGAADPQPIRGDFDSDGDVDIDDLDILLVHYGVASGADGADGDMHCDGDVNLADLGAFLTAYANTQP